jgi:nucleotide-binding universal stress UspA family protein
MRVLLVITENDDLESVGQYIAQRFNRAEVDVDVVAVMNGHATIGRGPEDRAARTALNTVAHALRDTWGIRSVQTHLEHGDVVDIVLELSRDCRSDLILLAAPMNNGLLASGFSRTTRRLFRKSTCSVELLRCNHAVQQGRFTVVVPLPADQVEHFPHERLRPLAWVSGTQINLLAVISPAIDEGLVEANPAAILRAQDLVAHRKKIAEGKLSAICLELTEMLGDDVDVDFEIAEGQLQRVTETAAQRPGSILLVIGAESAGNPPGRRMSNLEYASIARAAGCSVLYFKTPEAHPVAIESPYAQVTPITGS